MTLHSAALVFLLAVASVTSQAKTFNFLDSVALYEQVFATQGKSLEPAEVRKLLEDLQASYYGLDDGASRSISDSVSSLIDACDTSNSSTKCYRGTFLKINSLLRANAQFTVNVVPYLQHCKNEMFVKCKQYFDGELKENVKHLDSVDRDEIKSLVEMVKKVSLEDSLKLSAFIIRIPGTILKKAVMNFLENNKNLLVDVNQSTVLSESEKCKKAIDSVCNVAVDQIGRSTQHYEQHFINDRDLANKLEPFELEWILNVKVCRFIQQDIHNLC